MTARIAAAASTEYAKRPESSSRELFARAATEAFEESGVAPGDLDAVYVGNFMGDLIEDQGHMGALLADHVGARTAASIRVESACASGGATVRQAVLAVESGAADAVLAGGVELMSTADIEHVTDALANAADDVYENEQGLTFPGIYALMARRYMHEFDVSREDLAAVSVKNHNNAVENPLAQFQRELTVEEVLESKPVATPLALYDACPVSDGASAVVLVSESFAAEHDLDAPVTVLGTGQSSDALALQSRDSISRTPAAERAAERAYDDAGITVDDVDVAEVHDCFTIAEILALEALGVYERGEGARGAVEGETAIDGRLPVNTSGGLLGKGHPVGVTGVGQIVELTKQLEGRHPNQVEAAEVALAHNVGGSGASATVTVLGGEDA
jgi:acetyl-CoA acetyltransferase